MCLISKSKIKKSNESVKCYKILDDTGTVYKTPWQRYAVNDDIVNGKETLKPENDCENVNKDIIRDGFIHSIDGYENAKIVLGITKRMFSDIIKNPKLFECEIPENTEYFYGEDNNHYKGYASKELKFIKEVVEIEE